MSSTQTINEHPTQAASAGTVDLKLEVITIPVSDIERAKRFYEGLGWRLDADFSGDGRRAVQLTAPGSPCSIHLGTTAVPGSAQGMFLVVEDIDAARADLIKKGVDVSEPYHFAGILGHACPAPTLSVAPTGRTLHSAIQMATAGCFRRSKRGFPDVDSVSTSRL